VHDDVAGFLLQVKAPPGPGAILSRMNLPFGLDEFFAVFARYNAAIWPAQLVAYAIGAAAVFAVMNPRYRKPVILAILAVFWAWNGIAYHWLFFSAINTAAYGFGAIFVLQATLFAAAIFTRNSLDFENAGSLRAFLGWGLIVYAALVYEILGFFAGHGLMSGPLFGVAPCPTTIFTIGLLLLAHGSPLFWLSIIPGLWALIGTSAAIFLGVPEDFGLAVAASILLLSFAGRAFQTQRAT
jgi:hypothetical protein